MHSFQQGPADTIEIEHADLVIDTVAAVPDPLNVWVPGADTNYPTNPYLAIYSGQGAPQHLEVVSQSTPPTFEHLRAGEGDQLDVQVLSRTAVGLITYHVLVVYTTSRDTLTHSLELRRRQALAVSTSTNWHVYAPNDGHFAPVGAP